jgi:hypothetical protein
MAQQALRIAKESHERDVRFRGNRQGCNKVRCARLATKLAINLGEPQGLDYTTPQLFTV